MVFNVERTTLNSLELIFLLMSNILVRLSIPLFSLTENSDYSSYLFVVIEKYFKITDGLSDVKDEYNDFRNNVENFVSIISEYITA